MVLTINAQNQDDPTMQDAPPTYSTELYEKNWATIDSLEKNGLPKSALQEVEKLFATVRKANNPAQYIKCFLHKEKYSLQGEEDGKAKSIERFEKEIAATEFPVQQILQSMMAELYKHYYDENQWAINQRTTTSGFENKDLKTWTAAQFIDKASDLYLKSLENEELTTLGIDVFGAMLTGEDIKYRPTLYDFLAFRAIDFFKNGQAYLTEPAYKYEMKEDVLLQPAVKFLAFKANTKDTDSRYLKVIQLFQNVIATHIEEEDPTPYLDAELNRIAFIYENSIIKDKEKIYETTLKDLLQKYELHPVAAEIMFLQAMIYKQKGDAYEEGGSEEDRLAYLKTLEICKECVTKYEKTEGANTTKCQSIINEITKNGNYNIQIEKVNTPNKPFLVKIDFKNKENVKLSVAKMSQRQKDEYNGLLKILYIEGNDEKFAQLIKSLPIILQKEVKLPTIDDYRSHSTEVKLDGLPLGTYMIFADEGSIIESRTIVQVSNMAEFHRQNHEHQNEIILVNRTTGEPLSNVAAELFESRYDNKKAVYKKVKIGNAVSNINGFLYPKGSKNSYFQVRFNLNGDTLDIDDNFYDNQHREQERSYEQTTFFLDRAIYRPGQTVYFKGIALNFDKKRMPNILKNKEVRVAFKDVNYQEVTVLNLRTNEFGTFNGEFTAPKTGLLGQMHIESSIGGNSQFFRVEEYKRPKFEVVFKPVEGSFRLNEEVKVVGNAKAFAGSNIDGAKVKYRVVRNVRYPFWGYYCWWRPFPNVPSMEITNGEMTTDTDGNFTVTFKAIPDEKTDLADKPQFDYTVFADVIDLNGETHSNETNVSIGTIAINADVEVAEKISSAAFKKLKISTLNLNGQPEAAQGTVKVQLLKSPTALYKARLWTAPDKPLMSKEEFKKTFPDLSFKNEDDVKTWQVKTDVFNTAFDTNISNDVDISKTNWKSGTYVLILTTKDKFGTPLEIKKYFTIYEPSTKIAPANIPAFSLLEKESLQPNDTAKLYVGSAYDKINVLFEIIRGQKIQFSKWMPIEKLGELKFKIEEADRGGLHAQITYIKENRFYQEQFTVAVPWKNKELSIEYQSFRDKLLPGQDEEWRIKISGSQKEKVAAEMVATLYDASLDQFARNSFGLNPFPSTPYNPFGFNSSGFGAAYLAMNNFSNVDYGEIDKKYRNLEWFDYWNGGVNYYAVRMRSAKSNVRAEAMSAPPAPQADLKGMMDTDATTEVLSKALVLSDVIIDAKANAQITDKESKKPENPTVTPRTNLKETVFFLPNLMTDAEGNVIVKFKMNEALTKWRFLALAHTQDLKIGVSEKEIVTQKDLMVMPNAPRFMREGDVIYFSTKISNLTEKDLTGKVRLELFDALTDKPCDDAFANIGSNLDFTAKKGQSTAVSWKLNVPVGEINALTWRVTATAGNQSDGEQNALPILTNRMLVTETKPLPLRGGQTKEFTFEAMQKATQSTTLQHHNFTLEFTQNPAWYAVQALPYLMEYPYECTEQIFSRYYANALASEVVNSTPKIKEIFNKWSLGASQPNQKVPSSGRDLGKALFSNLQKNQELKSALLEETPWVMNACNEEQQKKNIALLFDLNRMNDELGRAVDKLADRQMPSGGFSWFPGGQENWYISQYLLEGFGHLEKLNVKRESNQKIAQLVPKAIQYIDNQMLDNYQRLKYEVEKGRAKWEDNHVNGMIVHYLYTRSFYQKEKMNDNVKKAFDYYLTQTEKYWLNQGIYYEGMIALALHRFDKKDVPQKIVKSLKERSLNNEELGMYWKNEGGYYWYQMPIETHALMIEVFTDVAKDDKAVDDLKTWLLKNKQTNAWKTTKATASAVYALLMNGQNWIAEDKDVKIAFNGKNLDVSKIEKEDGTGYFKESWKVESKKVENGEWKVERTGETWNLSDLSKVKIENPNKVPVWGALYWQYFENLDKIKDFKETPLTLQKQLFKEENSDKGLIMKPITSETQLAPGNKLKVRIELRVDRDMEYVHLKDMRASGFEPTNVLSQYKYQGGLGYYESTKDAATNFFFDRLPKGTYVFEYPLVINHKGDFSNGISTIQCMYAPEFSSHSEGVRVKIN